MFFFYIIIIPILIGMTFAIYFSMGTYVKEVSSLPRTWFVVFRFMLGFNNSIDYYAIDPILFTIWSLFLTMLYFYLILPVSIAVLLEAF